MLKKEIVFLFTHLLLKFTVSFPCEDQWQTTVFAVPLFVTKRNHRYFHITLLLLLLPWKITYAHHRFKIMILIRSVPSSWYSVH